MVIITIRYHIPKPENIRLACSNSYAREARAGSRNASFIIANADGRTDVDEDFGGFQHNKYHTGGIYRTDKYSGGDFESVISRRMSGMLFHTRAPSEISIVLSLHSTHTHTRVHSEKRNPL